MTIYAAQRGLTLASDLVGHKTHTINISTVTEGNSLHILQWLTAGRPKIVRILSSASQMMINIADN
jgi:hypothetical protein